MVDLPGEHTSAKRALAARYQSALAGKVEVVHEPAGCRSNYWLNAIVCDDRPHRDAVLKATNDGGVMTRPIWTLMTRLPMYAACDRGPIPMSEWLEDRVVNIPSGVTEGMLK